jgi:hypothetical protein
MSLHSVGNGVTSTSGVAHGRAVLHVLNLVEETGLFGVEGVKTSLLNDKSDNFKGFLITPIVNLGHGEIIQEAEHLLVSNRSEDTSLMFSDFTFNTSLGVGRSSSTGEIDSLEGVSVTIELGSVHQDYGGLSSTSSTDQQGVLETVLSTLVISLKGELGNLINDVLSTSRVTGRNKELGEHNLLGSSPAIRLPETPVFGLGIKEVIEDSFLLI